MMVTIDVEEAHRLATDEGFVLVDVRTEGEFARAHPSGAVNVPGFLASMGLMPNPEFLQIVRRLYGVDTGLVLVSSDGRHSERAAQLLVAAGFEAVCTVDGGFDGRRDDAGRVRVVGWVEAGLPVGTEVEGRDYAAMRARAASMNP